MKTQIKYRCGEVEVKLNNRYFRYTDKEIMKRTGLNYCIIKKLRYEYSKNKINKINKINK